MICFSVFFVSVSRKVLFPGYGHVCVQSLENSTVASLDKAMI